jgi:hypothetical protein
MSGKKLNYDKLIPFAFVFFHNPLSTFSALALYITASSRLSYAIIASLIVIFVYVFSVCVYFGIVKWMAAISLKRGEEFSILPHTNNADNASKLYISVLISTFASGLFYIIFRIINPLLAIETQAFFVFIPIIFCAQDVMSRLSELPFPQNLSKCLKESVCICFVLIVLSFFREPLGYGTLSIPGSKAGIIELFNGGKISNFSIEIMSLSSGAFILLGLIFAFFKLIDRRKGERR